MFISTFHNLHETGNNIPREKTKRDCNMYARKYTAAKIMIIEIIGWFLLNWAAAAFSLVTYIKIMKNTAVAKNPQAIFTGCRILKKVIIEDIPAFM